MSDRSVRAAVTGLAALPAETGAAADALADELTELTARVVAPLQTTRNRELRTLPGEIERLGLDLLGVVRELPGAVAATVADELSDLTALLDGVPGPAGAPGPSPPAPPALPAGPAPPALPASPAPPAAPAAPALPASPAAPAAPAAPAVVSSPAGTGAPEAGPPAVAAPTPPEEVAAAVRAALGERHPELADVVARCVADTAHPLDLTRALADPRRRERALAILAELAEGRALAGRTLEQYRREHPGRGPLFVPVPPEATTTPGGRSRKEVFSALARQLDPARAVGVDPTPGQVALVGDYVRRLRRQVAPYARGEVEALAEPFGDADVSLRVKHSEALIEKVSRMTAGRRHRPGRPEYRLGDILDAVGVRITVADTTDLGVATDAVVRRYGIGDTGRVLDMENMYAAPKRHNPAYRAMAFVVGVRIGGLPYPFEIQLCTRRASVASDLEHNTVYKPYVAVGDAGGDRVRGLQAEAAALDQQETRSEVR